ncbi:kinase-like protein [Linnemannia elongata AG-77]|uniref:Kinase-like protein n=1 Tax=Linnemannia elongata AG-77 TaxID=1314771 RepID=A0A197JSW6_9FUNG|nr:kinase-like protein [Linnemannia elongata AG-77]
MSSTIVPHISTTSSASRQTGVELPEAPTEPGGQEVVGELGELAGELTGPSSANQPTFWAGADLPSTITPPNCNEFLTSDAEEDLDQEPTAPQSTALQLYLSLSLPSHVPASGITSIERAPLCTPTELAPAPSLSSRQFTVPPPTPPRPRHWVRERSSLSPNVNLPKPRPPSTPAPAYVRAPGYIEPYKRYRDWSTGSTFEYLGTIAAGGFGCALRVMARNRFLALKVCADNEEKKPSYDREVAMLSMLKKDRHPNIIAFGSAFRDRDQLCVSLELANMSLEVALRATNKLDVESAKHIAAGIARGISHLHGHHILHRDIKPENVLLTGALSKHAIISDFGLSISLKDKPMGTRGECGTTQYRAPEMKGRNYYSYPVDVYAYGVTVYRIVGGQFPEQGGLAQLTNMEAKGFVDQLMHQVVGLRLEIDRALEHSFFQVLESDQKSNSSNGSSSKRPLNGATDQGHDTKRARYDNGSDNGDVPEEVYNSVHISFSERPIGQVHSLEIVKDTLAVADDHAFSSI